jgi:thymidine phosphorylase
MYALRDVTATVESVPLIVSSILSKKIAEGIDALVLDVKCGRGAFMQTEEEALALARELTRVGTLMGKEVVAFVTDMDLPLGDSVGSAAEAECAIRCLRGEGPGDIMELVFTLGAAMVALGRRATGFAEARGMVEKRLADGSGLARFRLMVDLQGGDPTLVDEPAGLPRGAFPSEVRAPARGFIADVDPRALGEAVVELGGGRRHAGDTIDPGVGLRLVRRFGEAVAEGEPMARIHAADAASGKRVARELVAGAFRIEAEPPAPRPRVQHLVTADGVFPWRGPSTWPGLRSER